MYGRLAHFDKAFESLQKALVLYEGNHCANMDNLLKFAFDCWDHKFIASVLAGLDNVLYIHTYIQLLGALLTPSPATSS